MIAPQPRPPGGQLDAAVNALTMQVDRDTVLQARAALLSEASRLKDTLRVTKFDQGVGRCGGDPVSADAATAFTERILSLLDHCWSYSDELEEAASALGEVARRYGFTDAEIASSFSA